MHYHRLHAHKSVHTKALGLFWQAACLLFCFMGQGGGGGLFCSAACDTAALFVRFVRKEAPVRSIHPLRRFPADCDVRVGKWAGLRILCLLWIWHELGPPPLWMWWMYYLIFLSLLTSFWTKEWQFWVDETTSPVWPLDLMKYYNDCNNRASSQGPFPPQWEWCYILSTCESTAQHRFK